MRKNSLGPFWEFCMLAMEYSACTIEFLTPGNLMFFEGDHFST